MNEHPQDNNRRTFLKTAIATTIGAALPAGIIRAYTFSSNQLQVWSCGGLAEAFMPANARYQEKRGIKVSYTGAFAAALGKSLLGSAQTEIFGARVLDLAKKLKSTGKLIYFKPLCFTSYVMITPKNNPGGIETIADLARPGVRVVWPRMPHLRGGRRSRYSSRRPG